jgi:hypothetical protein
MAAKDARFVIMRRVATEGVVPVRSVRLDGNGKSMTYEMNPNELCASLSNKACIREGVNPL